MRTWVIRAICFAFLLPCIEPTLAAGRSAPVSTVESGQSISGTILSKAGTPIAGARVQAMPWLAQEARLELQLAGRFYPDAVAVAETDAAGRFSVRVPSDRLVWL